MNFFGSQASMWRCDSKWPMLAGAGLISSCISAAAMPHVIDFKLPKNVDLVSNDKGIIGGVKLWGDAVWHAR